MDLGQIDLDHTLSCGQAFRWKKQDGRWRGIVAGKEIVLHQLDEEIEVRTTLSDRAVRNYFRLDDDTETIFADIGRDRYVAGLLEKYRGLRLLRQDPWECSASYILATYANVPRIIQMVEKVCRTFGTRLSRDAYSFPNPEQILRKSDKAGTCGLGYRCDRFVQFARSVHEGEIDFRSLRRASYSDCIKELVRYDGIGNKVADCVAIFSLDHLEAFPIDVRIGRALEQRYGVEGSYRKVGEWARQHFGRYAGYAQEYIYYDQDARNRPINDAR
jgi:N-glycosylase/DNA lyase